MKYEVSPRPWVVYPHGDLAVHIVDSEGTIIAHMMGKPGCAFDKKGKLNGVLFGNARLITKLVNKGWAKKIAGPKSGSIDTGYFWNLKLNWSPYTFTIKLPEKCPCLNIQKREARKIRDALNEFLGEI
jgi:hypothetical protein